MKKFKLGFSLAEAMITLMIISLILAAVIPVMSRRQLTSDSMWKYASNNSDIFYGEGASQAAIIGSNSVPQGAMSPKLVLVTHADSNADTIKRSMIDFYQKTSSGITNIGKISFDNTGLNAAIGKEALKKTTISGDNGKYNTGLGSYTLTENTTGTANTAVGVYAMQLNQTGVNNTAVGVQAMQGNKTGYQNTAVGNYALLEAQANNDTTAIGYNAMSKATDAAVQNTAVGSNSLFYSKSSCNTAVGAYVLNALNLTGNRNVAIGNQTLSFNTSGYDNAAMGLHSLLRNETGYQNTAVGIGALRDNKDGHDNTGIGWGALMYGASINENVSVGNFALTHTTGNNNTAIGYDACREIQGGDNNICIGYKSGPLAGSANVNHSKKLYIDIERRNDPLIWGAFDYRQVMINGSLYTTSGALSGSDKKLKNVGKDYNLGLENILKLKIKDFTYKSDKQKRLHHGVIAQDVQKIMPDAVIKGPDNKLFVDVNEVVYTLVNAVKQLHVKICDNLNRIKTLEEQIKNKDKQIEDLQQEIKTINKRLSALEKQK